MMNLRKIQVKMHAKLLMEQAEQKLKTQQELKNVDFGQSTKASVPIDNLFDLLYDQSGTPKTKNLTSKIVVRGQTLEILESHGNSVGFE